MADERDTQADDVLTRSAEVVDGVHQRTDGFCVPRPTRRQAKRVDEGIGRRGDLGPTETLRE